MRALWTLVAALAAQAVALSDEEYFKLPNLFELDDHDACLALGGAFCLGSFHLADRTNTPLMRLIQQYSSDRYHFNRSSIHRGLCLASSCAHIDQPLLPRRFEACVDNVTRARYGLEAHMYKLEYCETRESPPRMPPDEVDLGFAWLVAAILAGNLIGIAYDLLGNKDNKPNKYLRAWSVRDNWRRLVATHEDGDPRLNVLNPLHGVKAITLIFVMMAHSVIAYHITYIYNPQFLEIASQHPLSTILHNGSVIVQTFVMLSSFLLAYNVLLFAEREPHPLGLWLLPRLLLQRFARITPVHLFVVGLMATWWRLASSGPLWMLVEAESARCRSKWWAQALYVHNFVQPDDKCLWQTWFLAVDMQLYVVAAVLTVLLARRPHLAVRLLLGLLVASIGTNFAIAYVWNLKPILFITYPELMRYQYSGEASFNWLYTAPWGSLPASLLGLLVAFVFYRLQRDQVKLEEKLWMRVVCRAAVPGILAAILVGWEVRGATSREAVALYAALDRPIFAAVVATAMIGFFYKIDDAVWRLLTWRGWAILARMSLSVLMVHWCYNLVQIGSKTNLARSSIYEMSGHWFVTMFMTYVTSLPLHLLVEVPLQKFLQAFFS